jgi:hypothetical protein
MFEVLKNKDLRKTYMNGFLNGFNSAANFWKPVKFENKTIEEMNKESMDKAWIQVGVDLRQAYDTVSEQYGFSYEQ